jgi:PTS system beta-glucosides-specific IIC component
MWATFLSAGVGGMIAGFSGARLYNFAGSGAPGMSGFIGPTGIDTGFVGVLAGSATALVLALSSSLVLGAKKDVDVTKPR